LVEGHEGQDVVVGVDVGKEKLYLVLYWSYECRSRPIVVQQPSQLRAAMDLLKRLSEGRRLRVALEASGTYGDAFRYGCSQAGLAVERVSGMASKKHAEVMDNTNSQHDGKDAGVIAELAFMGKSKPWVWEPANEIEGRLRVHAEMMIAAREEMVEWIGRLESRLARHWPEVLPLLDLQSSTLLEVLVKYPSPAKLGADPEAAEYLAKIGGWRLSEDKIEKVVSGARETVGVPVTPEVSYELKYMAEKILSLQKESVEHEEVVERLGPECAVVKFLAPWLGRATAVIVYLVCGNPGEYPSGRAYLKALGLNLVEHSSGLHQGRLHISKRGSGLVRKWLYLAALRMIREEGGIRSWYLRKVARDGGVKMRGVIGVMRKLALSIYHCCSTGDAFDREKVFQAVPQGRRSGRRSRNRRRIDSAKPKSGVVTERKGSHHPSAKVSQAAAAAGV
jgi:transposase